MLFSRKCKGILVVSIIIIFSILFVGVPLVINECYKADTGYITKWGAADVLSYYGVILGSIVAIISLMVTITVTRKQILSERTYTCARTKWEQTEAVVAKALLDISPLKLLVIGKTGDNLTASVNNIVAHLNTYALNAKTSLDTIKCYVSPDEYKKIEPLINAIFSSIQEFCSIEEDLMKQYSVIQTTLASNGHISDQELHTRISEINRIMERVLPAHSGTYQNILNLKRDIFERIYIDIEAEANQILFFKRRKAHADTNMKVE